MSGHLEPIGRYRPDSFCEEECCWESGVSAASPYTSRYTTSPSSSSSFSPLAPASSTGTTTTTTKTKTATLHSERRDRPDVEAGEHAVSFSLNSKDAPVSNTLKLLFFICGLSTFARSESVLMQTQMYTKCFDLGTTFYPSASSAIFMPGILIQLVQNRYDRAMDRKFTTYRASHMRILTSSIASLGALLLMIVAAYHSPQMRDNRIFIYSLLAVMGIGISITFGAFVQIVTMFPPSLHPFFFMGTYAPFFIFAPVNVGIGDLCELHMDAMGGDVWELRWNSILVYYIVAAVITLAGLICFYGIAFHPVGKQMFRHKDEELRSMDVDVRGIISVNTDEKTPLVTANVSQEETDRGAEMSLTILQVLRRVWREATAQVLVTIISTIVAALYIDLTPTHFMDLPTILLYDYYICASAGTFVTSIGRVRRLFTPTRIAALAAVRVVFLPLAILYKDNKIKAHDDYAVIGLNSLHMFLGGIIFSLTFSMATDHFRTKPARTLASTLMNIIYYVAMAVGMGISFAMA